MLETLVRMRAPPLPRVADYSSIFLLRDLCVALSSCIYQALCDSDSIDMRKLAARDGPASAILEALSRLSVVYQDSSLINTAATNRRASESCGAAPDGAAGAGGPSPQLDVVTTEPSRWPGVASLRALLDREKDEETPSLPVLLCETFVAVYVSLLSYALASCDAQVLYRLVSQRISPSYWSHLFGGGARRAVRVETAATAAAAPTSAASSFGQQVRGRGEGGGGRREKFFHITTLKKKN